MIVEKDYSSFTLPAVFDLAWGWVDLREEISEYERKFRKWPRSTSCSKPMASSWRNYELNEREKKELQLEEWERWHVWRLL